jgi:hypothetical protein
MIAHFLAPLASGRILGAIQFRGNGVQTSVFHFFFMDFRKTIGSGKDGLAIV